MENEAQDFDRTDYNQKWYSVSGRAAEQIVYVEYVCVCVCVCVNSNMVLIIWLYYELTKIVEDFCRLTKYRFNFSEKCHCEECWIIVTTRYVTL